MSGRTSSEFESPSETVAWVEQWSEGVNDGYVGGIWGSGFINCDTGKLAGRKLPHANNPAEMGPPGCASIYATKPTPGHRKMGNYVYVDGHSKVQRWHGIRGNDFFQFKVSKPVNQVSP
jgi:prepilin-type processing-associated H-X9-DG protein